MSGTRAVGAADRVDQGDAILREEVADLFEIFEIVSDAHMLKHTNRDNTIVLPDLVRRQHL